MPDDRSGNTGQYACAQQPEHCSETAYRVENRGKREENQDAGKEVKECTFLIAAFPINAGTQAGISFVLHSLPSLQFQLGELRSIISLIELLAADKRGQAANRGKLLRFCLLFTGNVNQMRPASGRYFLEKQRRTADACSRLRREQARHQADQVVHVADLLEYAAACIALVPSNRKLDGLGKQIPADGDDDLRFCIRSVYRFSSVRSQNTAAERVIGSDGSLTISLPYFCESFQCTCFGLSPGT